MKQNNENIKEEKEIIERLKKSLLNKKSIVEFKIGKENCLIYVLTKDWAGLVDAVAGLLHRRKFNLKFIKGEVLEEDIASLVIEIEFKNQEEKKNFVRQKEEIKRKIELVSEYDPGMTEILKSGMIKVEKFKETLSLLFEKTKDKSEDYRQGILKEIEKFFASRSWSYIDERKSEDLARQILTNYELQMEVKEKGEIAVNIENVKTSREHLTCITVAWWDRFLYLDFLLDILREVLPNFKRKFDKLFTTPEGITVIRLEITDENDNPIPSNKHAFIENYIKTHLKKVTLPPPEKVRISPEMVGRVLIPRLIEETRKTSIPHVYFILSGSTREYFYIKTVFVTRNSKEHYVKNLLQILKNNENVSVASIKPPTRSDGMEINIVDLRASRKNLPSYEEFYREIKDIFKKVLGNYRDFDEGMRQLEIKNLEEIMKILYSYDADQNDIKKFFYSLDEFYRVSTKPKELSRAFKFMWETLKSSVAEGGGFKLAKKHLKQSSLLCITGRGADKFFESLIEHIYEGENYILKFEEFGITTYLIILSKKGEKLKDKEIDTILQNVSIKF